MSAATATLERRAQDSAPVVSSAEVLRGGRVVLIRHGAEIYTLRVTRQGKLLLTK